MMKKVIIVAMTLLAFCFGGCKEKTVSTQYTIGCLEHVTSGDSESQWEELVSYFQSHVVYNDLVTFEGISLAENDAQARQYFDEQIAKIDKAYICSLISSTDYFVYGIATMNASGTYRYVKAMKFWAEGTEEIME